MVDIGSTSDNTGASSSSVDRRVASKATASATGQLQTGTARVFLSSAGSTNIKMLVYSDSAGSPGNLLALSDPVTITNTTEQAITANYSGAQKIIIANATDYWIGFIQQDPGTPSVTRSQGSTASIQASDTDTYATGPASTWGTPTLVSGPLDAYITIDTSITSTVNFFGMF